MNKSLKEELSKVKEADLSNYDETNHSFFIKKKTNVNIEELKYYLIEIKNSICNNSSLACNWNNNQIPTEKFYRAQVVQKMYNMIKVTGVSYNIDTQTSTEHFFSGWLPLQEINIIEEIL